MVASTGRVVAERVRWARSFRQRARGLLRGPPLAPGEGLVLEPAKQVHTIGMRYAIDVVFCDRDWVTKRVLRSMQPDRISRWVPGARFAIELRAGSIGDDLVPGQRLVLSNTASPTRTRT